VDRRSKYQYTRSVLPFSSDSKKAKSNSRGVSDKNYRQVHSIDEVLKRLTNMLRFYVMHFKGQHNATTTLMHFCARSTSAKRFSLNGRTCVFCYLRQCPMKDGKNYDLSSIRYVKNGFDGFSVPTSRVHCDSDQQLLRRPLVHYLLSLLSFFDSPRQVALDFRLFHAPLSAYEFRLPSGICLRTKCGKAFRR